MDELKARLLAELRRYAGNRLKDVARSAETRALAALLVEKYGYGLAKALNVVEELQGRSPSDLNRDIEQVVLEVDPQAVEHRRRRWDTRPADLHLTGDDAQP